MHIKKQPKASFFLHAFGCTTSQQLTLITAGWVCTEQPGLRASPQSDALIYSMARGEIKSHFTHTSQKRPNTDLFFLSLVLWFSVSERVPALGFIHCIRLKSLVYTDLQVCVISLCYFSLVKDSTQENDYV